MKAIKFVAAAGIVVAFWWAIMVVILILPEPARAQTMLTETAEIECGSHAEVAAGLAGGYGEVLFAVGTVREVKMETWVNPETLTWTVLMVHADGKACMIASGSDFSGAPNA